MVRVARATMVAEFCPLKFARRNAPRDSIVVRCAAAQSMALRSLRKRRPRIAAAGAGRVRVPAPLPAGRLYLPAARPLRPNAGLPMYEAAIGRGKAKRTLQQPPPVHIYPLGFRDGPL